MRWGEGGCPTWIPDPITASQLRKQEGGGGESNQPLLGEGTSIERFKVGGEEGMCVCVCDCISVCLGGGVDVAKR